MRVAYFIWTYKKGVGGHFFSLNSLVRSAVRDGSCPLVINIGGFESPIIEKNGVHFYFEKTKWYTIPKVVFISSEALVR